MLNRLEANAYKGRQSSLLSLEASHAEERKRTFRATVTKWIAIAVALVFALLAGAAAYQWYEARQLGMVALARQLAAQSELVQMEQRIDLEPAALLATESMLRLPSFENDRAVRESTRLLPRQTARLTHQGPVYAVAFSADGRQVATGSWDHTARVFDAASGKEVSRMTLSGPVLAIHYTADERYLMTASEATSGWDIVLTRHLLRPQDLIDDACSRLTRNLTPGEWKQYTGAEVPYHKTCPNLP